MMYALPSAGAKKDVGPETVGSQLGAALLQRARCQAAGHSLVRHPRPRPHSCPVAPRRPRAPRSAWCRVSCPPLKKKRGKKRGEKRQDRQQEHTPVAYLVITSRGFLHTFVCVLCVFVRVLCMFVHVHVRVRSRSRSCQVG